MLVYPLGMVTVVVMVPPGPVNDSFVPTFDDPSEPVYAKDWQLKFSSPVPSPDQPSCTMMFFVSGVSMGRSNSKSTVYLQ